MPRGKHPGRQALPAHLPREKSVYDLKPEEKACGSCGDFLSLIGHDVREQLDIIIKFIVKRHKRLKYACRCCGDTGLPPGNRNIDLEKILITIIVKKEENF